MGFFECREDEKGIAKLNSCRITLQSIIYGKDASYFINDGRH